MDQSGEDLGGDRGHDAVAAQGLPAGHHADRPAALDQKALGLRTQAQLDAAAFEVFHKAVDEHLEAAPKVTEALAAQFAGAGTLAQPSGHPGQRDAVGRPAELDGQQRPPNGVGGLPACPALEPPQARHVLAVGQSLQPGEHRRASPEPQPRAQADGAEAQQIRNAIERVRAAVAEHAHRGRAIEHPAFQPELPEQPVDLRVVREEVVVEVFQPVPVANVEGGQQPAGPRSGLDDPHSRAGPRQQVRHGQARGPGPDDDHVHGAASSGGSKPTVWWTTD